MTKRKHLRCAIYTRKSSEEGLDQDFNSLHAQREACEAYITSQQQEGWRLLPQCFDDGGYSGGSMDRPALQQLLAAIRDQKVDVIVVYKVDRLTRSLADFAKMVELFDENGISFVSVTQQFNTTSSMGRLTLNVLLSFAQFEREVTGERIRDKIALSKRKGLWMGGNVPLGYDTIDRKLVVNAQEAETVRWLFEKYLELGSVRELRTEAARHGLRPKQRRRPNGACAPRFSRGNLYRILQNPIYIGRIRHKTETFPGQHAPIVDQAIWDRVQATLAANCHARRHRTNAKHPSLLTGLLFDVSSSPYGPSHAVKQGRRYRYYVERVDENNVSMTRVRRKRLPATEIERVVLQGLSDLFADPKRLIEICGDTRMSVEQTSGALRSASRLSRQLQDGEPAPQRFLIHALLGRVIIEEDAVALHVRREGLKNVLNIAVTDSPEANTTKVVHLPIKLRTRGVETKLVLDDGKARAPDPALLKSIARAHAWFNALQSGRFDSISKLAKSEGVTGSYLTRIMRFAFLAPDITKAILDGTQPVDLTAKKLFRMKILPSDWQEQRRLLGFSNA